MIEHTSEAAGWWNTQRPLTHPSGMSRERGLAVNATHEEWRPVAGFEGVYEVSNLGRVKSLPRMTPTRWGTPRFHAGGILKAKTSPTTGYVCVTLVDANRGLKRYANIHRLVLDAFVGPCPDGMEACHNDGDRANARLDNLRWDTRSANTLDAVHQRTNHHAKKTRCPNGHLYDGVYHGKRGTSRYCKRCTAERARLRHIAKKMPPITN
ncbi:NUMOD4 motif-containing HNH endonuclease [Mycolicibacterium mageritense]|uniref:NUMOD4 motif-containing HNH endonuclease n=1 Tax=Mycolicibacterium mageritense TaxID=53462 RepID=UPI002081ADD1|nr:hypothetical protein MTY414_59340 [Mycolicibacterium mageritense]